MISRFVQTVALSLLFLSVARADDPAVLADRLQKAASLNSINVEGLKPWHLKLEVELFGDQGKLAEQGVIEEWWASPTSFQIAYSLPSYTATEVRNEAGFSRTKTAGPPPLLLRLLLDQVVDPMPSIKIIQSVIQNATLNLREQSFGKVPLECIMVDQKVEGVEHPLLGTFPTYCFDPGKSSLRIVYTFGSRVILHNSIGNFQERTVPTKLTVHENNSEKANAHVSILESNPSGPLPPIDSATLKLIPHEANQVAPRVMAGHILKNVPPVYPEVAKIRHLSGTVVLHGLIGTDGRVHTLEVVSSPDPSLSAAALTAVRQWTYSPYLLDGEPVDVDTMMTISFGMR